MIPLERYTAFGRAEYEINRHAKFYGQFMYTDYTTSTELAPAPGSNAPLLAVVTINGNTINSVGGTGFYVPVTNPFIPADLRTLLANRAPVNGVSVANSPFVLNKRTSTFGPRHSEERYNTSNFTTGVTGEIGFKDWTYDVYASYGRMSHLTTQTGNVSHQAVQQLLQAADGGASACAGGYNPFGLQPVSAACQSFVTRTTKNYEDLISRDVEATFQGSLIELPAGTMKFALGADYRRQSYGFVPDAVLSTPDSGSIASGITPCTGTSPPQPTTPTATAQAGCNYTIFAPGVVGFNALSPLKGSIDTYEIFGELFVPILRDLPLIKTLNANLGYRFSDYNLAGSVNSYKIDAEWKPVSWALVRGGYQRAVRAPSIGELFAPQNNNFPSIGSTAPSSTNTNGDPCDARSQWRTNSTFNNAAVRALCLAQGVPASAIDTFRYDSTQVQTLVGGNTNLKSEIADTYSVGVVLTPHFDHPLFRRMSMSVDYYNIKVNHVIGAVGAVTAIDKCYNFQGANPTYSAANAYCSYFVRDPSSGFILTGNSTNQNLGRLNTSGEDIQFDWAFGLGALGMNDRYGQLSLNVLLTHLETFQANDVPGSPLLEFTGSIGGFGAALPEWKGLTTVTYSLGPVDLTARWRYIGAMQDVSLVGAPAGSTASNAPTVNYFDVIGRWKLNDTFELRAGVNNVTDKQPPFITTSPQANTDPSTYDVYGRRWFAAIKARF